MQSEGSTVLGMNKCSITKLFSSIRPVKAFNSSPLYIQTERNINVCFVNATHTITAQLGLYTISKLWSFKHEGKTLPTLSFSWESPSNPNESTYL